MSRKEIILLIILAGVNFTNIMDFMIMMPLQEFLAPVFNISPQQFSFLVSSYGISAFVSSLTASFIVDKFDRKRVLVFVYTGFIIATLACGFAPTYALLMTARILAGIFGGLIGAQVLSIVGDTFTYERRGRAMGILMSAFSLAAVAGVPTGLYLATRMNWQVPFLGIGILGIILLPMVMIFIPKMVVHLQAENRTGATEVFRNLLKNRNQQFAMLMMFTLILSHFATIPFIAPYLEKNVGFTKEQISLMYFIGGICSLISSPIIGRLADKFGKHKVFSVFIILSIIPVILLTNMPRVPYYYVLMVTATFFIFAGGRMIPAQALITSVVHPKHRGGFMNLNSSLMQLGTALAAFISGAIVTKNSAGELEHYQTVGYISVAISLLCLLILQQVKAIDFNAPEAMDGKTQSVKPVEKAG